MTVTDVLTISIAAAAFTLSLVSLIWQVIRSRYDRPVLGILATGTRLGSEARPSGWRVSMTITNVGERPVTIMHAWVAFSGGLGGTTIFEPDANEVRSLPYRLEAYDSLQVRMTRPGHDLKWSPEMRLTGRAQLVVRPSWLGRMRRQGNVKAISSRTVQIRARPDRP